MIGRSGVESIEGGSWVVGVWHGRVCSGWCMIGFSLLLFLSFSDVTAEPFDSRCIS